MIAVKPLKSDGEGSSRGRRKALGKVREASRMRPWSRPRQKDGEGLKEVPPCRRRNWPAVWTGPGIEYLFIRFCMENPPFLYPWRSGVTGPLPLRKAPGLLLLDTKKPAPSQWENSDTLKHGYCACLCNALLLYGYSIADAPQKVKLRSGSYIIIQKWADCPLNITRRPTRHAASSHRTYNLNNVCNAAPWQIPGRRPSSEFHGERTNNQ